MCRRRPIPGSFGISHPAGGESRRQRSGQSLAFAIRVLRRRIQPTASGLTLAPETGGGNSLNIPRTPAAVPLLLQFPLGDTTVTDAWISPRLKA